MTGPRHARPKSLSPRSSSVKQFRGDRGLDVCFGPGIALRSCPRARTAHLVANGRTPPRARSLFVKWRRLRKSPSAAASTVVRASGSNSPRRRGRGSQVRARAGVPVRTLGGGALVARCGGCFRATPGPTLGAAAFERGAARCARSGPPQAVPASPWGPARATATKLRGEDSRRPNRTRPRERRSAAARSSCGVARGRGQPGPAEDQAAKRASGRGGTDPASPFGGLRAHGVPGRARATSPRARSLFVKWRRRKCSPSPRQPRRIGRDLRSSHRLKG